jgi:hypothetical protein
VKCPSCFAYLGISPVRFVCVGSCSPAVNAPASAARGYEVKTKPVFGLPPPAAPGTTDASARPACPRCSTGSTTEVCGYCSFSIPPNWRSSKVTCVAIAGARATGKSLLLAVAKEQMELLVERHHRSVFRAVGDTERFFDKNYTEPLFEQRQLLRATASISTAETVVRQPLIFAFTERNEAGQARSRVIVLRDVAGEDLEAMGGMDQQLSFFSRADAVIALLDPLTVSTIQAMLADLVPATNRLGGDGVAVLQHVLGLMTNHAPGARTPIPFAVVLSKFDVLQKLREVSGTKWSRIMSRPGSPLQRDPSLRTARFDEVDANLLHEEIAGLVEMLGASALTSMLSDTADRFRYFGVSALGESPEGDLIHAGGIAPFRVLDPFKWALEVTG